MYMYMFHTCQRHETLLNLRLHGRDQRYDHDVIVPHARIVGEQQLHGRRA